MKPLLKMMLMTPSSTVKILFFLFFTHYTFSTSGCSATTDTGWSATTNSFTNLTETTWFRAKLDYTECGVKYSNTIETKVIVCPAPLAYDQTSCTSYNTLTATSIGSSVAEHRWYTAQTGGSFITPSRQGPPYSGSDYWVSELDGPFFSTITYWVSSVCSGMETARTQITFTVSQPGELSISTGGMPPNLCIGNSITLTPGGGSSYSWSSSPSGASGSGSITVSPGENTTYTLSGYEAVCGTWKTKTLDVYVSPKVGQVSITGTEGFCHGTVSTSTYTASATDAASYQWSLTPLSAGSINASGVVSWSSSFTGTATVSVTAFSGINCNYTTNASKLVNIIPIPATPTAPNVNALYGSTVTLQASDAGTGETYRWYNAQGSLTSNIINTSYLTSLSTTYTVSLYNPTSPGCETPETQRASQTLTLYLNPPPGPAISTNTCGPKTFTLPNPPSGVTWYWQGTDPNGQLVGSPFIQSQENPEFSTYTFNSGPGPFYIRGKANNLILWSTAATVSETSSIVDPVDITLETYDPNYTLVQATHSITLSATGGGFIIPAGSTITARIAITSECNDFVNWTESILYNESGVPVATSKSYYDGLGKPLLNESKDHLTKKVFASQPLYDTYGMPVAGTLPAPILEHDFIYKNNFVRNEAGDPYSSDDFDLRTETGAPGEITNPKVVGQQPGTVGWYYSSNNSLESNTPVTDYPYARSYTPEGPDPTTTKSSSVGDSYKMGSGHEVTSERQLIEANDLTHYLQLRSYFVTSSLPVTGYKYISTDPDGKKTVTFVDVDGRRLASATLTGTTFNNWNYSYYNDLGQLVASVAPNGVIIGDPTEPNFVTRYKYDHLGRLIETTSPDEGKSQFVYSTDGKIRFSQNEQQATITDEHPYESFSYTNYDYLGRLIESGEYTGDTNVSGTPYIFQPHSITTSPAPTSILNNVDDIGFSGVTRRMNNLTQARYSDTTFIKYDYPDIDFPADANHSIQEHTLGQVSTTRNGIATTWYSYDEFDQLKWTKQYIAGLGYRTIDYTYDYFGNVTEVVYQAGQADQFFHYYEYDLNQRLINVSTASDGTNISQEAAYFYYLHGPLKRVELGNKLQGIDYVYNIDGSLKLINHPDPEKDPGVDGLSGPNTTVMKDIFGQAIDYYTNDYTGAAYDEGTFTSSSYPDKFGGTVKAVRWHSQSDNHVPRVYAFQYDNLNQLINADWGSMSGSTGSYGFGSPGSLNAYQEDITRYDDGSHYDKNGNIRGLVRKGKTGNELAQYIYNYTINTNKLAQVVASGGDNIDYVYNFIGQMTQQSEGGNTIKVKYNAYGLVKEIRKVVSSSDRLLTRYEYDDRGNRVLKTNYDPNTESNPAIKNTFYVYDASGNVLAIYEQQLPSGTIVLSEVPVYGAGRIAVYKPSVQTTFYEVVDHLGNVRGVIGKPSTLTYTATMEDNGQAVYTNPRVQELAYFKNLSATEKQDEDMNHTSPSTAMPAPEYSSYLHWISGQSGAPLTQSIGPAIGLKVEPGDKLDMEAWGKFEKISGTYSRPGIAGTMASILGNNFVGTASGIDVIANATQVFNDGLTSALGTALGNGNDDPNERPYAYLYYLLYDKTFDLVTAGWNRIPVSAGFDTGYESVTPHQRLLIPTITVNDPGYIYIFVANESENVKVWFDDLKIDHQRSDIVAGADYYPFGLAMENREITREPYRYGYQGQFSEKDLPTGQQEFELRNYDVRIGRWLSSDPLGQYYSPYMAMGNAPHMGVDPNGGWSWATAGIGFVVGAGVGYAFGGDWQSALIGGVAGGAFGGAAFSSQTSLVSAGSQTSWMSVERSLTLSSFGQGIGNAFSKVFSPQWAPLTKSILTEYVKQKYAASNPNSQTPSGGGLENRIGNFFENQWHLWALKNLSFNNYRPNSDNEKFFGDRNTLPDGFADHKIVKVDRFSTYRTIDKAAWFEVKAKNGQVYNSTSTGQIGGHIENLANSNPAAVHASVARLFLVTTSNVTIAPSVATKAIQHGVTVHQMIAKYKLAGGNMKINFILK